MKPNMIVPVLVGLLFLVMIIVGQGAATVESGTVGVVTHFGAVQDEVLQPGIHLKIPIMTQIISIDTRIQKVEESSTASSKDLQVVTSKIALNYRIDPTKASQIYSKLGLEFAHRIVEPALQESIKATSANYTASELITKRTTVADEMLKVLTERLLPYDIQPTDLSIIDFNFSKDFNEAIEQKQVEEQAAQRASNVLTRIKIEAEQVAAKAEGVAKAELARAGAEAEAQRMLRDTISPELLQLRAIEKWDGILPVYSGGGGQMPGMLMPVPAIK